MPGKPKRRQYFIKKDYQLKFILKFCLIVLSGSIISTAIIFFLAQGTLTSSFEHGRLIVRNTATAIMPAVIMTNVITLVVISFATIVVVLFISHKIAGPLYRFEQDLKEIGQGDLTKTVRLRSKDQFTNLSESMNSMTTMLHGKVVSTQEELEQLIKLASEENASQKLVDSMTDLAENLNQRFNGESHS
jgi:methyl-accepting chemotaxis protein